MILFYFTGYGQFVKTFSSELSVHFVSFSDRTGTNAPDKVSFKMQHFPVYVNQKGQTFIGIDS